MDLDKVINDLSIKYGLKPADIKTRYYRYRESALFYENGSMECLEQACIDLLLLKMFDKGSNNEKRIR